MVQKFPIDKFKKIETPFYYYDCDLLRGTLQAINKELKKYENFIVHYAIKANANAKVLYLTTTHTVSSHTCLLDNL